MEMKKLKRVVIKEELVALTGDFKKAVILNQLIYWSERVASHDQLLQEELERIKKFNQTGEVPNIDELKSKGWIYKTAKELGEETMIGLSDVTIRRTLKGLIEDGFLSERNNPSYKWDKTKQFRVNLLAIQKGLLKLGYTLEGYSLGMAINHNLQNEGSILNDEDSILQNEGSNEKNEGSSEKNEGSELNFEAAIPKITTEITTEITHRDCTTQYQPQDACSDSNDDINQVEIVENNTHLKLSKNQISNVLLWDVIRLKKSIKIFKEQEGKYFALLEKIYKDNGNFAPKNKTNKNNYNDNNKPSNFANFTQRQYDYNKLEKQLLGWDDEDNEDNENCN